MKDIYIFIILIFLSLIIFFIDYFSNNLQKCLLKKKNNTKLIFISLIHHIFNIFMHFGWIFNNKRILMFYLLLPVITLIHWKTNNDKCILTESVNKICGFSRNNLFNDLFNMIGLKKYKLWNQKYHYVFLIVAILITIYKITGFKFLF